MRIVATGAALVALAVPAAAEGATFFNGSTSNGGYVIKSGATIQHFEIYCAGPGNEDTSFNREYAFSLAGIVTVKKGKFTYSGKAYRYGTERQPNGVPKVKLSGRVTSTAVHAKWSLPGCGSGTTVAPIQR